MSHQLYGTNCSLKKKEKVVNDISLWLHSPVTSQRFRSWNMTKGKKTQTHLPTAPYTRNQACLTAGLEPGIVLLS